MNRDRLPALEGLAPFLVSGLLFGLLYNTIFYPRTLVEYAEAATIGIVLGGIAGVVEQTLLSRALERLSLLSATVTRAVGYGLAVAATLALVLSVEPWAEGICGYVDCLADYVRGPLFGRDLVFTTIFVFLVTFGAQLVLVIGTRNFGRILLLFPLFASPSGASAQNNGLPGRQESAVLVQTMAERGEECGLLRPWRAESLRIQTREMIASFDEADRVTVESAIEERRSEMTCEDSLLNLWIEGSRPGFEREYLPELLIGYSALAGLPAPPEVFSETTGRTDYTDVLEVIERKVSELEAEGVTPRGSWSELRDRQRDGAAQLTAAIEGTDPEGRYTPDEARWIVEDIARIVELWLADQP